MTNLCCSNYCNPTTGGYCFLSYHDGGALPHWPVVSDPNGCGGFPWLLLRHKTAPLKRGGLIAKSAFLPARSPSAAGYTTQRRGRWQRCAEGSCSSSDRWTWGSSGHSLRGQEAPISFQSVSDLTDVTYQKENDLFSWTGASPLQFAKYTRTPTFWQSVQIWEEKKNQWIKRPKMNQQGNPQCWDVLDKPEWRVSLQQHQRISHCCSRSKLPEYQIRVFLGEKKERIELILSI